jgi:hypothetical protein
MPPDSDLLLALAAFLAGVATTLLAVTVPDFLEVARHVVRRFRDRMRATARRV